MSRVEVKNNDQLIDSLFDRLGQLNLLDNDIAQEVDYELARETVLNKIDKLKNWGKRLGITNVFLFEDQELKATRLVNGIQDLSITIRTSAIKVESFKTKKKNPKNGKMEDVTEYDTYIKSPNHTNHVEKEILELLDLQQVFLNEVIAFTKCVNELDTLEKKLIYHHYLKYKVDNIPTIQIHHINCCSLASVYRMKEKSIINLYEKMLGYTI